MFSVIVSVAFIFLAKRVESGPLCESPWKEFKGRCFLFSTSRQSYDEAQKTCYGHGGFLASVRNGEEFRFMSKVIQTLGAHFSTQGWFIGMHQINVTGGTSFRWLDGSVGGFRNWMSSQPNNIYEECVMMDGTSGLRWRDELCNKRAFFVCRKEEGQMDCYEGELGGSAEYDVSVTGCIEQCRGQAMAVAAIADDKCGCYNSIDTSKFKIKQRTKCNALCAGQHCGANGHVTIYNIKLYQEVASTCEDLSSVGIMKPGTYILQKDMKGKGSNPEAGPGTSCFSGSSSLVSFQEILLTSEPMTNQLDGRPTSRSIRATHFPEETPDPWIPILPPHLRPGTKQSWLFPNCKILHHTKVTSSPSARTVLVPVSAPYTKDSSTITEVESPTYLVVDSTSIDVTSKPSITTMESSSVSLNEVPESIPMILTASQLTTLPFMSTSPISFAFTTEATAPTSTIAPPSMTNTESDNTPSDTQPDTQPDAQPSTSFSRHPVSILASPITSTLASIVSTESYNGRSLPTLSTLFSITSKHIFEVEQTSTPMRPISESAFPEPVTSTLSSLESVKPLIATLTINSRRQAGSSRATVFSEDTSDKYVPQQTPTFKVSSVTQNLKTIPSTPLTIPNDSTNTVIVPNYNTAIVPNYNTAIVPNYNTAKTENVPHPTISVSNEGDTPNPTTLSEPDPAQLTIASSSSSPPDITNPTFSRETMQPTIHSVPNPTLPSPTTKDPLCKDDQVNVESSISAKPASTNPENGVKSETVTITFSDQPTAKPCVDCKKETTLNKAGFGFSGKRRRNSAEQTYLSNILVSLSFLVITVISRS